MKRLLCLLLLAALLLSLTGCSMLAEFIGFLRDKDMNLPDPLAAYTDDAPAQIIRTKEHWVTLISAYGSSDYAVSVSTEPEKLRKVYTAEGVTVWFFEATDEYVAWCEWSGDNRVYKVYSIAGDTVETILSADVSENYQPSNIGILGDGVYYANIDYTAQKAAIYRYDMNSHTAAAVRELDYAEEYSLMCMSVEGKYLSYAAAEGVETIDLETGETVFRYSCPEELQYVYAVSYDASQDVMGIYYADSDSEDVGIVNEADGKLLSLVTFNEHHYAYQDQILCTGGHIYWIAQANVTGQVADHYTCVDYNYLEHTYDEIRKTFHVSLNGDAVYLLRFGNTEGIGDVELYEIP